MVSSHVLLVASVLVVRGSAHVVATTSATSAAIASTAATTTATSALTTTTLTTHPVVVAVVVVAGRATTPLALALATRVLLTAVVRATVGGLAASLAVGTTAIAAVVLGLLAVTTLAVTAAPATIAPSSIATIAAIVVHGRGVGVRHATTSVALVVSATAWTAVAVVVAAGTTASTATTTLASVAPIALVAATTAPPAVVIIAVIVLALTVLLDFRLVNGRLVADVVGVTGLLAERDLEHGHNPGELEMVKTLLERLVLIHNRDVVDLVQLVQALDPVLDQLGQLDSALDSVRHALNDDVVVGRLGSLAWRGSRPSEQLMRSLQVATDTDTSLDANLIGWKHLLGLLDSHVLLSHLIFSLGLKID